MITQALGAKGRVLIALSAFVAIGSVWTAPGRTPQPAATKTPMGPGPKASPGSRTIPAPGEPVTSPKSGSGEKGEPVPSPDGIEGPKQPDSDTRPRAPSTTQCNVRYQNGEFALAQPWEMHIDRAGASSYGSVRDRPWVRVTPPFTFGMRPDTKQHVGHVWFRCSIEVDGEAGDQHGLSLGLVMDVDEVFFNGTRVGGTGSFQPVRVDIEKQRLYSLPKRLWRPGANLVVIHLYGTRPTSGLTEVPRLVDEPREAKRLYSRDIPAIILSCIYVLVSLFFGLFAVFFWHRKENLYFALFSLSLGVYYFIRTRMRYEIFSDFSFSYKVELILLILAPVWFLNFFLRLIRIKAPPAALAWQGFYGLLVVSTLMTGKPSEWDMVVRANLAGLGVFIVLMTALFRKHYADNRGQLRYLLLGLVPIMPALLNDMMVAGNLYNGPRLVVYAFLIFLTFVALQLADSVLDLYRNLQEQENELRQLEKRKTSSIFNISSEFRTIFEGLKAVIDGFSAGKAPGTKKTTSEKKLLSQEIARLNNFLTDSNLLPLLESGDYVARRVRFSVRKMAEAVMEKALLTTGKPSRRLGSQLPPEELEMTGDPDLISSAILHLVENALLYTNGQVEVSVEKEGNLLVTTVRDEGPGLGEEQRALVFQKFVRGVDENSEVPGTGVGLHIVGLIARRLDGTLRLEAGGGFFSTFVLSIPLASEQRAA